MCEPIVTRRPHRPPTDEVVSRIVRSVNPATPPPRIVLTPMPVCSTGSCHVSSKDVSVSVTTGAAVSGLVVVVVVVVVVVDVVSVVAGGGDTPGSGGGGGVFGSLGGC